MFKLLCTPGLSGIVLLLSALFYWPVYALDPTNQTGQKDQNDEKTESSAHSKPASKWSLEKVIQRVFQVTPEIKSIEHQVQAKYNQYKQAGKWSNPVIDIRSDDRLEKTGLRSGYRTNDVSLSQSLSLSGRHKKEKRVAYSAYQIALENAKWSRLNLEAKTAILFFELQLSKHRLILAKDRLQASNQLQKIGQQRARAGDLSRFHRDRLSIVREKAQQQILFMETRYTQSRNRLLDFINIPYYQNFIPGHFSARGSIPNTIFRINTVTQHPQYQIAQLKVKKKKQELALAKARRVEDIDVRVIQEKEAINNRIETIRGVGIKISLPIWNRRTNSVKSAVAILKQQEMELQRIKRNLRSRLQNQYLHFQRLHKQVKHYENRILAPSRRVFMISKLRFKVGEAGVLSLIDAVNTYYEAKNQYLDLLSETLKASVKYKLAAGQSISNHGRKTK